MVRLVDDNQLESAGIKLGQPLGIVERLVRRDGPGGQWLKLGHFRGSSSSHSHVSIPASHTLCLFHFDSIPWPKKALRGRLGLPGQFDAPDQNQHLRPPVVLDMRNEAHEHCRLPAPSR